MAGRFFFAAWQVNGSGPIMSDNHEVKKNGATGDPSQTVSALCEQYSSGRAQLFILQEGIETYGGS